MGLPKTILVFAALTVGFTAAASGQRTVEVSGPSEVLVDQPDLFAIGPVWSPSISRNQLAFTTENYRGIWLKDLDAATTTMLSDERAAGFGFRWSSDGSAIAARIASFDESRRRDAIKIFVPDDAAAYQITAEDEHIRSLPEWTDRNDALILRSPQGYRRLQNPMQLAELPAETKRPSAAIVARDNVILRVSPDASEQPIAQMEGDVLNLRVSPDRSWITFEVLGGDLYLSRADGSSITSLGRGNRPSWSPDSEWVVYMRTLDDGHEILSSDLMVASTTGEVAQLTSTSEILEMNPSWSPRGDRIAYDFDGRIYALPVTVQK